MSTAKITSKGQITIPIEIRTLLDLQNGDKVNFIVGDCGQVNFLPVTKHVTTLKGIIPKPEKAVSIEDMKNTIRAKGSQS